MRMVMLKHKIRKALEEHDLEAFLFVALDRRDRESLRYLSGFQGYGGVVIWSIEGCTLLLHPLEAPQAEHESFCEVVEAKEPLETACQILKNVRRVGIDLAAISAREYELITRILPEGVLVAVPGFVPKLAIQKDPWEQELLVKAAEVTCQVLRGLHSVVRKGMSEADLAAEIVHSIYMHGGDGTSFDTIVAFSENAYYPHHPPSRERKLRPKDLVLVDFGASVRGYGADLTRVFSLGEPSPRFKDLYGIVWKAQEAALERVVAGVKAEEVDAAARHVFEQLGYHDYFTHGVGHGLGVGGLPRLEPGGEIVLAPGMVFTIEPGLYIPGLGGIRIEDDILLTKEGPTILTTGRTRELPVLEV